MFDLLDRVADLCQGIGTDGAEPLSFPTPGKLAKHLDPRTVQTGALDILDAALVDAVNGVRPRLIFSMPPQEGKTQRVGRTLPAWILHRNPDLRIGIVSYAEDLAVDTAGRVRQDIESHPELEIYVSRSTRAKGEWRLRDTDGGVIARGIGGGLTGKPLDVLIIDDPLKDRQEANSEVYRKRAWNWWTEVGSARLGPGAVVVVIMTRWHEEDLAGQLLADDRANGVDPSDRLAWRLINIPAKAEHEPDNPRCKCGGSGAEPACYGSEILGRQFGEYMPSARGRTQEEWENRERTAGPYAWSALYQGHPSPADGGILKRSWFHTYDLARGIERSDGTWMAVGADQVWMTVDATFTDTSKSDYVAIQIWGHRGARTWLLDQVWDRMDFVRTCREIEFLAAKWPQCGGKLIEAKANGPAVIATLGRKIPGIIAITPTESKEARVHSCVPFIYAGSVELPSPTIAPWVVGLLDEAAGFPNGAHDDQVDAMTQLVRHLFLAAGSSGDQFMQQLLAEQRGAAPDGKQGAQSWTPAQSSAWPRA